MTPKEKGNWIPVSERLPEDGQLALVLLGTEYCIAKTYRMGQKRIFYESSTGNDIHPSHWQPLPSPPKL